MARFHFHHDGLFICKINLIAGVIVTTRIPARRCYFRTVRHLGAMLKAVHLLQSVQACDFFLARLQLSLLSRVLVFIDASFLEAALSSLTVERNGHCYLLLHPPFSVVRQL